MEKQLSLRLALALLATLSVPAGAQDVVIPPPLSAAPVPIEEHLGNYGALHPECTAWTNSCAICSRTPEGKNACSTPGIACTPVEITCTDPSPK